MHRFRYLASEVLMCLRTVYVNYRSHFTRNNVCFVGTTLSMHMIYVYGDLYLFMVTYLI